MTTAVQTGGLRATRPVALTTATDGANLERASVQATEAGREHRLHREKLNVRHASRGRNPLGRRGDSFTR